MLFLLFRLGADRYALDSSRIAEVLPLVALKQVPLAPQGVAGVLNFRGQPVPVVDLSLLALGRPASLRFSTRIVLVPMAAADGAPRLLGLIAEEATETLRCHKGEFQPAGVVPSAAPYLGPVRSDAKGIVQWVDPGQLLSPPVRDALFAAGWGAQP